MNGSYSIDGYYSCPIINEHFTFLDDELKSTADFLSDLLKKVKAEADSTQKTLDNQYNIAKNDTINAIKVVNEQATQLINDMKKDIDKNTQPSNFDC